MKEPNLEVMAHPAVIRLVDSLRYALDVDGLTNDARVQVLAALDSFGGPLPSVQLLYEKTGQLELTAIRYLSQIAECVEHARAGMGAVAAWAHVSHPLSARLAGCIENITQYALDPRISAATRLDGLLVACGTMKTALDGCRADPRTWPGLLPSPVQVEELRDAVLDTATSTGERHSSAAPLAPTQARSP